MGPTITGTFNGLIEGATISNFLGSGLNATISYTANADGGSVGNDVVLTVTSGTPTLSINDVSVTEGNSGTTTLTFTVTLTAATSTGFTVGYSTQDGTATVADQDYVPVSANLRIGAFDASRGGDFSLASGSNAAAMKAAILSSFPGATITGTSTLTSAFLKTVDVVWLNSVATNFSATSPLSAAEQAALQNFVTNGGGAIIFGEHTFFNDTSLLAPFGLSTDSALSDVQPGTVTSPAHPLMSGPFGNVTTISGNYPGNLTTLGGATSLATWNSSGLPAVAVLASGAGEVVVMTDVNLYADRLNQPGNQNRQLLLNALEFARPEHQLTFNGTAGEMHTISITVNGDTQIESNETLSVLLGSITGSSEVTILDGTGVGTILTDDVPTPPVINSNGGGATASLNIPENTTAVTTVTASDPGDTLTYSITGGADKNLFTINPTSGVLSFVTAPDFENPLDAGPDNNYVVIVTVTDGTSLTDSQTIDVTVTNVAVEPTLSIDDVMVNEGPTGQTATMTFTVTLSAATASGFTVSFMTQDGTAMVADNDYLPIPASDHLRVGSFNAARGGSFSLANGGSSAAMRAAIQANFSGATFASTSTLTSAFLKDVDVLWLNSVSSNTTSTAALSAAEQAALTEFVQRGGGVLIFGENGAFDDESLLDPFGVASTGILDSLQTGTITNTTHAVTNGPFGAVHTLGGNYPGNLTTLGSATSLGTWNSSGQSNLAVVNRDTVSPGSGLVVLFADVNLYADQLNVADNSKLLLNALAAAQPSNVLTFAGTAGETHSIYIRVTGDFQVEGNETFSVLLGSVVGTSDVSVADGTGTGTIVNDEVAPAPPVVNDQTLANLNENSSNGTVVGTVVASDPGDVLTYSILSGNTGGAFAINSSTGQITVANSAAVDFETNPTFSLTVQVKDQTNLTDTAIVTVNLNNLQGTLSIDDISQFEGDSGTSNMTFHVTLTGATGIGFQVPFQTADGTATAADNDYVPRVSNNSLVIGAFNGTRGGDFSLSDGSSAAQMKAAILANFPGATIVGTNTLDAAFLATVNVVWLNSVATNTKAVSPLTVAEQTALVNFVNSGHGAILFGEHNAFDDSTLLSPFGLSTDSSLNDIVTGTITNLTHPVTHGPFGDVHTLNANYVGNLTGLGSATSLGTWDNSGLSAVAALTSGAGNVVVLTDVNLYADRLAFADNQKLLLNAVAFAKPTGNLQFAGMDGEIQTISVTINRDVLSEPDENFSVLLTNIVGSNDVTILDGTGTGTIQDDDGVGTLHVSDALVSERSGRASNAVFRVQLSSPSSSPVTVSYSTTITGGRLAAIGSGPMATAGRDYTPRSGTIRFAPGQMSQTISVPILDDSLSEPDEFFFVQLNNASGAVLQV
jgi:hypothetical protein